MFTGCKKSQFFPVNVIGQDEQHFVFTDKYGKLIVHHFYPNVERIKYPKEAFKRKGSKMYFNSEDYSYRLGVDISRHDKKINWEKVKKAGYDFAIIRIGWRGYQTGILHEDENFHQNIKGALENGFDVGVYVFSQAMTEAEAIEEADLVIRELTDYKITLPVVFDPEYIYWDEARTDNTPGEVFTKTAHIFCDRIKQAGYEPMLYCNLEWATTVFNLEEFHDMKLWYADYDPQPRCPYHFVFWQYLGEKARVPGIKRKCDVDIMITPKPQVKQTVQK